MCYRHLLASKLPDAKSAAYDRLLGEAPSLLNCRFGVVGERLRMRPPWLDARLEHGAGRTARGARFREGPVPGGRAPLSA